MRVSRPALVAALLAVLASCGGEGSSSAPVTLPGPVSPAPTPSASATTSACSLRARQDWALAQLQEWYLFPDALDTTANPAAFTTVDAYIDALTAPARAQAKDRYFTYLTSIADENAFYASGSSAGFGVRLAYDSTAQRVFVTEAFEGAPALASGLDRGTEIIGIGTTASDIRPVSAIFAAEGAAGVSAALGASQAGLVRYLRVVTNGVQSDVRLAKADYNLVPVSPRYGAKVIDDGGRKVGYLNLRTFIDSADPALRTAIDTFRAQGVSQVIVDLRYNGGGLISIAELFGSLLGADRDGSVFSYTTYRPEKASRNASSRFARQPQSIAATRIAFIGTTGTASASEMVINAFTPYLGASSALVGTNTYGKPVGQIALDRSTCDDRLRVVALRTENSAHQGDYYTGLAGKTGASCAAPDDYTRPFGDPAEASVRTALDFLAGRGCTPIGGTGQSAQSAGRRQLLMAPGGNTAQREVPGLF